MVTILSINTSRCTDESGDCHNGGFWGGCPGHQRDPKTRSNEPYHEHFDGQPDDLILKVEVTQVKRVDIVAESLSTSKSTSTTFELPVGANHVGAKLGKIWTYGTVRVKTITVGEEYTVTIAKTAIARGAHNYLEYDRYSYSAALASFDFDDNEISSFASATYTPDPDILD